MFGAFISILLLVVARHHPPSRERLIKIWHGRTYLSSNNITNPCECINITNPCESSRIDELQSFKRPSKAPLKKHWEAPLKKQWKAPISAKDRALGTQLNVYVYPLPPKFHLDVFNEYNKGCLMEACFPSNPALARWQYVDYAAEPIILSKLLSAVNTVKEPDEADMFLVPALLTMVGIGKCRGALKCKDDWYDELFKRLIYIDSGKPHIFISTQDWNQNHRRIRSLRSNHNAFVINYGPNGLIVPSLNPSIGLQPSYNNNFENWATREFFLLANFGVRYHDRTVIMQQLRQYNGPRVIKFATKGQTLFRASGNNGGGSTGKSTFILCLPGDLPFQKRFFDAILHLTIPVVVRREIPASGASTYWEPHPKYITDDIANYSVENSYPDLSFTGVDYKDFVVELEPDSNVVESLNVVYADSHGMDRRFDAMKKIRNYFVYDMNGTTSDAVTLILETLIEHKRKFLARVIPTPSLYVPNSVVSKWVDFDWKTLIETGDVNSLPGTTGAGVPGRIQTWLTSSGVSIDDDAQDYYGSGAAVVHMEKSVCGGWDAQASNMRSPTCVEPIGFDRNAPTIVPDPSEIDIVTPSIRNLDFLNDWREFFQGFHVIIIQDGDQDKTLRVPDWVDYELHKRVDIERTLGKDKAWIISQRDASIRNYGFLLSKKRYVFTIDDDCRPAYDQDGYKINPLAMHYHNLKTPSTPYMFNTIYDPYQSGADFVRGYPYSLRPGVPTGVSHGLWVNAPDYDAPTQLMKIDERVARLHDIVQTVPAGIFFPLCSMNVAFDRKLIGPAMMQGLMGAGQPWGRYDDMFSGWASKSIADHLGVGVKSGQPYIRHNKASNPFVNLRKEYIGLWWQESVLRFFMNDVRYSPDADTPSKCYRELAAQIRTALQPMHQYFDRLATAMELWVDVWDKASSGEIHFRPSRASKPNNKPVNLAFRSEARFETKFGNINLVPDEAVTIKT